VATLTWGLPTSLAGTRAASSKDSASPSTNSSPVVWANAAKVVAGTGPKKAMTMKHIQEEEERRKQREKELATTARRVGEKVGTILMNLN
jgi:PERQ amino acid-rich with GYF domain-containing protein